MRNRTLFSLPLPFPVSFPFLLLLTLVVSAVSAVPAYGRARTSGYCEQGGQKVSTSSILSTTSVQQSYPSCTVTVYITGSTAIAALYSDNNGTPRANPFTASTTGYWFYYADNGVYDAQISGGGIPSPFTRGAIPSFDPFSSETIFADTYNFPVLSCSSILVCSPGGSSGGALGIGSNFLTFVPVPAGINGTNTPFSVYVSGGTGTAESCAVTGGTAVSGSSTGALTINCAGTHTGAWTIRSATSGGGEAAWANPGATITFGTTGVVPFYGTLTMTAAPAQNIFCAGRGTILTAETATLDMIDLFGTGAQSVWNCNLDTAVSRTAGSGIQLGDGIVTNSAGARIVGNRIASQYQPFYAASGNGWSFNTNTVIGNHYDMLIRNLVNGDQGDITITGNNFQMSGSPLAAIRWESAGGIRFADNKIVAAVPYALDFFCTQSVCTGDLNVVNNSIESYLTAGMRFGTSNANYGRVVVGHNQMASVGVPAFTIAGAGSSTLTEFVIDGNDVAGGGLVLGPLVDFVKFQNNLLNMAGNTGVAVDTSAATATNFQVSNNTVFGYTPANPYGSYASMVLVAPSESLSFAGLPSASVDGSSIRCAGCTPGSNPCITGGASVTAFRVNGAWQCNGLPSFIYGPEGVVLASASTITPTASVFHVTGTTQINTITLPAGFTNGTICAIPDGVWSTGISGNISIASTAVVGQPLCFTRSVSTSKWNPSYSTAASTFNGLTSTNTVNVSSSSGNGVTSSSSAGVAVAGITTAATASAVSGLANVAGAFGVIGASTTGAVPFALVMHTFASLPACSGTYIGAWGGVTDSTTATWGATITGSGANNVLAFCNGTNWTVFGK